jgi:hypothetical protein
MNYVQLSPTCSRNSQVINHNSRQTSEGAAGVLKGSMYHFVWPLNLSESCNFWITNTWTCVPLCTSVSFPFVHSTNYTRRGAHDDDSDSDRHNYFSWNNCYLTAPYEYTFSLMNFIVNKQEHFRTNWAIHNVNTLKRISFIDKLPTSHVFRRVLIMLALKVSRV